MCGGLGFDRWALSCHRSSPVIPPVNISDGGDRPNDRPRHALRDAECVRTCSLRCKRDPGSTFAPEPSLTPLCSVLPALRVRSSIMATLGRNKCWQRLVGPVPRSNQGRRDVWDPHRRTIGRECSGATHWQWLCGVPAHKHQHGRARPGGPCQRLYHTRTLAARGP